MEIKEEPRIPCTFCDRGQGPTGGMAELISSDPRPWVDNYDVYEAVICPKCKGEGYMLCELHIDLDEEVDAIIVFVDRLGVIGKKDKSIPLCLECLVEARRLEGQHG